FNIIFYRRYRGLCPADLREWHRKTFAENLQRRVFPAAVERLREHQRQGHRVVLVTGALDCVMRPLAEWVAAADLIAVQLAEAAGICTGMLTGPPIGDEQKARLLRGYAAEHGIDLAQSFAYGNSVGDVPMLACVGHPVAVNADRRLRALAAARGWGSVAW